MSETAIPSDAPILSTRGNGYKDDGIGHAADTPARHSLLLFAVTTAVLTALLPVRAIAASRSAQIVVRNHTTYSLTLQSAHLDHGCWPNNRAPGSTIGAGEQNVFQSESCGFPTGTEGRVT